MVSPWFRSAIPIPNGSCDDAYVATRASQAATAARRERLGAAAGRLPPTSFFMVSAVFHYLGPSLAVLLFAHVAVLGVMWLRIASAAVVFAAWQRPWRLI